MLQIQITAAIIRQRQGTRRTNLIGVIGLIVVVLYASVVEGGSEYSRSIMVIEDSENLETIEGASEIQCILRCRKDTECKMPFYEKQGNLCSFLKNSTTKDINNFLKIGGIWFEKIQHPYKGVSYFQ